MTDTKQFDQLDLSKLIYDWSTGYDPANEREAPQLDTLAAHAVAAIPAAQRDAAIDWLIESKMQELIAVDCLLDETSGDSWKAIERMGSILRAEITAQHNEEAALHQLVREQVRDRIDARLMFKHGGFPESH